MLDVEGSKPAREALVYRGRRQVGHVTSAAWSPTAKRNIAFAEIAARHADSRDLRVEIHLDREGKRERRMARARVIPRGVFRRARARKTPPDRALARGAGGRRRGLCGALHGGG